jgi:hypothetical protein
VSVVQLAAPGADPARVVSGDPRASVHGDLDPSAGPAAVAGSREESIMTEQSRCIAPVGRPRDPEHLCGEPATATRVVEGLTCPLCAEHCRQIGIIAIARPAAQAATTKGRDDMTKTKYFCEVCENETHNHRTLSTGATECPARIIRLKAEAGCGISGTYPGTR